MSSKWLEVPLKKQETLKWINKVPASPVEHVVYKGVSSMSILDWLSDKCAKDGCEGTYEFELNGGGTCNTCGDKIPCF